MSIRIAFTSTQALTARCDAADARASTGDPGLDDEAIIPADCWRPLRAADAEPLRATADDDPATVIELARILPGRPPEPDRPLTGNVRVPALFADQHAAQFLAYADSQPGQATTTIDPATGRRIGIHLDNFDKLPLAQRTASRRRLGLNLGPGVRHLLLGNIDILDICQAAGIRHPRHCPHTDDIRRHVADRRALPLLRLRLDPGDGYIAPTELVPHDGSTLTGEAPSRIAFWLGHWPTGIIKSLI
jgi:hypothetical protein